MKVGIHLNWTTPAEGGGHTFQDDVLNALAGLEGRHRFVVLTRLAPAEARRVVPASLEVVSIPRGAAAWLGKGMELLSRAASQLPSLRERWGGYRPFQKLLDRHGVEMMWFLSPAWRHVDVPYIFTIWDLQHRRQPWFPEVSACGEWRLRERMFTAPIQRAAAVIIGAEAGRRELERFYGILPERVLLVPHPTPRFALEAPPECGRDAPANYGIPPGYLFYPAQFWPHKNHVGILHAVRILRDQHGLKLSVVFAGSDKGNLAHCRRVAEKIGVAEQVHWLGFVSREELVGLYRNALALVYMSFFGPENLPPLEAFALECPVIAGGVAGAEEQLGDAALLVETADETEIARAVAKLHSDPALRETLIRRGRERARRWTSHDFVRRVDNFLNDFERVRRCWRDTKPYRGPG